MRVYQFRHLGIGTIAPTWTWRSSGQRVAQFTEEPCVLSNYDSIS